MTHGITYLPKVDCIITMADGRVTEVGTYDELIKKEGAFAQFISTYLNEHVSSSEEDEQGEK